MTATKKKSQNGTTTPDAAYTFMDMQSGHNAQILGEDYPLLQWLNGRQQLKQLGGVAANGGFVIKFDQDPDFPVGNLTEHVYSDGSTGQIFDIGAAHITILASRIDWYTGPREDKRWLPKYQKDAKGRNRWLLLLKGAEEWHQENGPLMLTLYGVNGVLMAREVVQAFGRIRTKAGAAMGCKLDDYTFWMPIMPGPAMKASDRYATMITPPQLNFSTGNETLLQDLNRLYIGDDMMALCASLWDEAQEWAERPLDAAQNNGAGDADLAGFAQDDLGATYGSGGSPYGGSGSNGGHEEGPRPNWTDDGPPFDDEQYDNIPF